jgi:hypothetical protein
MHVQTLPGIDVADASRLLIHAAGDDVGDGGDGWSVESIVKRMRAHVLDGSRGDRAPLALEIHDLQGHRMLALGDAGALVDVVLPPGTYHVSTQIGSTRRRYTVSLEPGASYDLYVRTAGARN